MIEVCDKPILWHLMNSYADQGFKDFVLCLGYKGDFIKRYFLHQAAMTNDFTIDLSRPGHVEFHNKVQKDWRITCVDTGLDTLTGGRLKRVERYLEGEHFLLTYGDGLSDVDVNAAYDFHKKHGKAVTVTGVRPQSRFGELVVEGDQVSRFSEKPDVQHGYINGGFFVMSKKALSYVKDDVNCTLEREPLEEAANDKELMVYKHHGYWQCMDTYRDLMLLESEWKTGKAPWSKWSQE